MPKWNCPAHNEMHSITLLYPGSPLNARCEPECIGGGTRVYISVILSGLSYLPLKLGDFSISLNTVGRFLPCPFFCKP